MAGGAGAFGDEESGPLSDINVVPLVDVVLVLLIVFMLTVPAIVGSAPIKVDLPETTSIKMAEAEDLPLHLFLRREPSGEVALYLNDRKTNEADLRSLLNGYAPGKEKPATHLAADYSISHGDVVKVMDMLASLGLNKLSIDTKHKDK
jgi:biopolymer transport protein ExbD